MLTPPGKVTSGIIFDPVIITPIICFPFIHNHVADIVRAKKANYDEYKKQERIVEDFIDPEYLWGTFFGCISLAMFISVILLNLQLSNDIDLDFITMSTPYLVALGSVSLLLIPG